MLTITNTIIRRKPTGPYKVQDANGKVTVYLGEIRMQMVERDESKPKTEKDETK